MNWFELMFHRVLFIVTIQLWRICLFDKNKIFLSKEIFIDLRGLLFWNVKRFLWQKCDTCHGRYPTQQKKLFFSQPQIVASARGNIKSSVVFDLKVLGILFFFCVLFFCFLIHSSFISSNTLSVVTVMLWSFHIFLRLRLLFVLML